MSVLRQRMVLRAPYALCGTERAYGAPGPQTGARSSSRPSPYARYPPTLQSYAIFAILLRYDDMPCLLSSYLMILRHFCFSPTLCPYAMFDILLLYAPTAPLLPFLPCAPI
eukprot:279924-Rhodomonas_salina.1